MESDLRDTLYQRILLKLSGEALQDNNSFAIDSGKLIKITQDISRILQLGVEIAIVIGGGNILRGSQFGVQAGVDLVTADHMGMLATVINGLALRDVLLKHAIPTQIFSALAVPGLVDFYNRDHAIQALQAKKVVIFVGGTGNPLVTTDSAAALRGIEIKADIVLKATKVDGVYAADPIKNPKAVRYTELTYDDIIEQRLAVMDLNAILLCQSNALPLRVFDMNEPNALDNIVMGKSVGTLIRARGTKHDT